MRRTILLLATTVLAGAFVSSASAQTIYETSFEASDISGASYSLGSLDGQGAIGDFTGWQVETGTAEVVEGPAPIGAQDGSNSVHQGENSIITAGVSSAADRVIIRAWHNGTGTTQPLEAPDTGVLAAAVLGFESTGADTYIVKAFDGPGDTGDYVAPASPLQLSTGAWNKIVVSVNYNTQTFDVAVNDQPYLEGLSFFNTGVTSFNGFQASSQASANIDLVGFFASDGDFDNDGISDDLEMRLGGDPLDSTVSGPSGDVNEDGFINIVDSLLYGRVASGALAQGSLVIQDLNSDGSENIEDANKLYEYVTNTSSQDYLRK